MQKISLLIITFSLTFLQGCATVVKYQIDKNLYVGTSAPMHAVVVDIFEDIRPISEKEGKISGKSDYATTKDKQFKRDINVQVSDMLAKHLKESRIFKDVSVENMDDDLLNNAAQLQALKDRGIDLAVIGKLKHFYGYQSDEVSAGVSAMFGLVGVLTEAMMNPKTVGAKVEYGDVNIIDIHRGSVIWEGNVNYEFEEIDKWYDGPTAYVLRALKALNNQFAMQLDNMDIIRE